MIKEIKNSQNFLNSIELVRKLVVRSGIKNSDMVVEIGPGKGIITKVLAENCAKVIAIEYDSNLYEGLKKQFVKQENVQMVGMDFLKYRLPQEEYKVFSNIPFNITAEILQKLLNDTVWLKDAFIIMQYEAAMKYAGEEGCEIYTDSEFWINVLTKWADGWKARGWTRCWIRS